MLDSRIIGVWIEVKVGEPELVGEEKEEDEDEEAMVESTWLWYQENLREFRENVRENMS